MTSSNFSFELKQLLKQSTHYLAGVGGGLALGFISFPIFTRVFSVADFGTIDLLQKLLLLLVATSKLGLQNSALRFYNAREFESHPERARRYYSTMFFGITAAAAITTAVFTFGVLVSPRSLISASLVSTLLAVGVLILLRSMQSIFWCFLRVEERTAVYNLIAITIKASTIALVCVLLFELGPSPQTYFIGVICIELLIVMLFTVSLFRRRLLHIGAFDLPLCRQALAFGAPLIIYEIANLVLDSADRVLVRQYLGAEALGLYSVAYGLASYVNELLVTSIGLAIVPIYMKLWTTDGVEGTARFLSAALNLFLIVAVGIVAATATMSRDLISVLASPKYSAADQLVPIIVGALLLYATYIFLSAGLLLHNRTVVMAKILLLCAVVNVVLNCVLLPRMGLQAAALVTLLSYGLCILLLARVSFRLLPIRLDTSALSRYVCAAFLTWIVGSLVHVHPLIVNLVSKGVIVVVFYCGFLYVLGIRVRKVFAHFSIRKGETGESNEIGSQIAEIEVASRQ